MNKEKESEETKDPKEAYLDRTKEGFKDHQDLTTDEKEEIEREQEEIEKESS
jgi:hypothetical protein